MTELKPCPFCGNEPEAVKSATGKILYIKCLYCLINKRIDSWNTRHYPAEVQQAIDKQKLELAIVEKDNEYYPDERIYSRHDVICPACHYRMRYVHHKNNPTDFVRYCMDCGKKLNIRIDAEVEDE